MRSRPSPALAELAAEGEITAETQEALDEAMESLAPSARGVVRAVGDIAPAWREVQQSVQQELFEGLGKVLRNVSDAVLPGVQKALRKTAGSLNDGAKAFGDFITSGDGAKTLNSLLDGLADTFKALLPGIGHFGAGLLAIFDGAMGPSKDLAEAFSDMGERFRDWAESVNQSGALTDFLRTANDIAGDLLGILGNLSSIIGSVFGAGAAQGATMLSVFEDATGKLADFLKTVEGKDALQSFFDLIKITGDTIGDLGGVVGPIFRGISDVIEALLPHVSALRDALMPVATVLGETIGGLLTVLAPVLGILAGVVVGVIEALAPLVTVLLQELVPAISRSSMWWSRSWAGVLGPDPVIAPFVGYMMATRTHDQGCDRDRDGIIKGLVKIIAGVVNVVVGILTGDWAKVWKGASQIVEGNIDVMKGLLKGLWTIVKGRIDAIAQIVPGIGDAFKRGTQSARQWIENLVGRVRNVPQNFRTHLSAIWSVLQARVIQPFVRLNSGVQTRIANLIGRVKNIPSRVRSALGNLGSLLYSSGQKIVNGLIDGLWSRIGAIASAMYGITSKIRSYLPFSPAKEGPLSGSGNPEHSGE